MKQANSNIRARDYTMKLTRTAMLCAIGILIPIIMPPVPPFRLVIEPMSFTLAAHVAIFIAMFISPTSAVAVTIGTTIGFFFVLPPVVGFRAASHIVFAIVGALYIQRHPDLLDKKLKLLIFSFIIAIIHAIAEVAVVVPFYFGGLLAEGFYARGFIMGVIMLVGVGTIAHSMVDFAIARVIWEPLKRLRS